MNIDSKINRIAELVTPEVVQDYLSCSPSLSIPIMEYIRTMQSALSGESVAALMNVALASFVIGWNRAKGTFDDDAPEDTLEQVIEMLGFSTDPSAKEIQRVLQTIEIKSAPVPATDLDLASLLEECNIDF